MRVAVKAEGSAKCAHVTRRKSRSSRVPHHSLIVPSDSLLEPEQGCVLACVPICTQKASCLTKDRRSPPEGFAAIAQSLCFHQAACSSAWRSHRLGDSRADVLSHIHPNVQKTGTAKGDQEVRQARRVADEPEKGSADTAPRYPRLGLVPDGARDHRITRQPAGVRGTPAEGLFPLAQLE